MYIVPDEWLTNYWCKNKMSSKTIIIPMGDNLKTTVTRKSPEHLTKRNADIVKLYKAGIPVQVISEKAKVSQRQIRNILQSSAKTSDQRQRWYDLHEKNAGRYRSKRQRSQNRFNPS
mmetsp:Transcript_11714/g.22280  ORF Transcript_11714/g.22280 Transcript_11714/m.22280 type:complete len:117 (+) Transcript_11714:300-650(+)